MKKLLRIVSWTAFGLLALMALTGLLTSQYKAALGFGLFAIGLSPILSYTKVQKRKAVNTVIAITGFIMIGTAPTNVEPSKNTPSEVQTGSLISNSSSSDKIIVNSSTSSASSAEQSLIASEQANTLVADKEMGTVTKVSDGDTVKINLNGIIETIRIVGIDAPEYNNKECYRDEATARLSSLILNKIVTLEQHEKDNTDVYGRLLRYIRYNDQDIGLQLVLDGFADSYDKYPHARIAQYEAAEKEAIEKAKGKWSACTVAQSSSVKAIPVKSPESIAAPLVPVVQSSSVNDKPEPVVQSSSIKEVQEASGESVADSCYIKGNINSKKKKLYHAPGCPSYNSTLINKPGERCFNSASEAEAAGWVMAGNC